MKKIDKKKIIKSLIIAIIVPIAFFLFELFIRQESVIAAGIGAGILFAIIIGFIVFFFISSRMNNKRAASEKEM